MQQATKFHTRLTLIALAALASLLAACGGGGDDPVTPTTHHLYTETNVTANSIAHLVRAADGSVTLKNAFATGGAGTNTGADPLVSQNAVIVTDDHKTLFAVNAASNSVSAFAIDAATGDLTLQAHNATTGNFPVSLAHRNGKLYVLFQGSHTVQAFSTNSGNLGAALGSWDIPNAGPKPTQITISPDGKYLVASAGTASNALVSYPIQTDGTLGTAVATTTGIVSPFAGVFLNNSVFLSSVAAGHALQSLNFSAGAFSANGTPVVGDPAGAPCWLVITPDGRFAYTGDGGSGTIVSYTVSSTGALTLMNAKAANENIAVAGDSWISADGKFLYTAYLAAGQVFAYAIGSDGSLTKVGSPVTVTPGNTMQGLTGL